MSPTARAEDASTAVPKYILWPYTPSIVAGAIATAVMLTLFLIHTARLFRSKTWFCIPFVLGALVRFESPPYKPCQMQLQSSSERKKERKREKD